MSRKPEPARPSAKDDDDDDDEHDGRGPGFVARQKKKSEAAALGKLLGAELDELLKAEKDRQAIAEGKGSENKAYKLYQTLYEYKSDDPDDLSFDAGEILRFGLSLPP